jgi:ribonuclease PH
MAADLFLLGDYTITIDCDVLQADGGTRTAAITGGYVALALAIQHMQTNGLLDTNPLRGAIAAVSVGMVDNTIVLDLDYSEDSTAEVDGNVVQTGSGELIEVQSTAERTPINRQTFDDMLDMAHTGIATLLEQQQAVLQTNAT